MLGSIVVFGLLIVTFFLSIPAASHVGLQTWTSLAASSTAFVAMALNLFLATRPSWIEGAFNGLDRIYQLHRKLGIVALVGILIHYFVAPNFKGTILTSELNALAKNVAEYAFYALVALAAVSLVKRIPYTKFEVPYQIWRQSHRLMGILFVILAFHQTFIKRPFDGNALLASWLNIFALLGIVSFLVTQLYPILRKRSYKITSVSKLDSCTVIEAKPTGRLLKSNPGQFAFIRIPSKGLSEAHPFTIAGRGPAGEIKFAIKHLGDFTTKLREVVEKGDKIYIEGGYGRFIFDPKQDKQIWLAGGIGITPFLAMAEQLPEDIKSQICLIHCVRTKDEAVADAMLASQAAKISNFSYKLFCSDIEGRIDGKKLSDLAPFDIEGSNFWFCGPPPLRTAIETGVRKIGKRFAKVHFEKFEFR